MPQFAPLQTNPWARPRNRLRATPIPMPGLLPNIDPDGLLEFSVVYTDRALNHMSKRFVGVVQDILSTLKSVYHAHTAVLVPGSGTFGMEAVDRKSTRLSSHLGISYAVFCLKNKKNNAERIDTIKLKTNNSVHFICSITLCEL